MVKLQWDKQTERYYEAGTDRGVIYLAQPAGGYGDGHAWNGLIGVSQSPDGGEPKDFYANNHKYIMLRSAENFKGSIKAYTYPYAFAECDGSKELAPGVTVGQQERKQFGMTYRTLIGNDTEGTDYGYKIHIIYGASVTPSAREYETINEDPNAIELSWDFETTPEAIERDGFKPTAYICIDSTKVDAGTLEQIEATLYGSDSKEAKLPSLNELVEMLSTKPTKPVTTP